MNTPTPPQCSEDDLPAVAPLTEDAVVAIAKALSHPARIWIVEQFTGNRPHMANEIVESCELAQSTVSEHLRILRKANVLFATKDGPRTWYCLRRSVLRAFAAAIGDLTSDMVLIEQL